MSSHILLYVQLGRDRLKAGQGHVERSTSCDWTVSVPLLLDLNRLIFHHVLTLHYITQNVQVATSHWNLEPSTTYHKPNTIR